MQKQNIPYEGVFDKFAIRVVYKSNSKNERFLAWKIYSIVTDHFTPNPTRLRDWISSPKSNGYESLHITVMGPNNKWIEVQIRSERMHEIAEKGYAAHFRYKQGEQKENGKQGGKAYITKGKITDQMWLDHLEGKQPSLGIIPIMDDSKCYWGCIDVDMYPLNLKELVQKIENGFNNLHNQLGLSNNHKQIVSSLWANDGSDNSAIEAPHRHVDGVFSAVYWPIADTGCAPLTFINPNSQMSYVFKSNIIEHMNEFNSDRIDVQPQLNQCVYFPSWLWHYVSHALSKTNNRMSFAFNSEAVSK